MNNNSNETRQMVFQTVMQSLLFLATLTPIGPFLLVGGFVLLAIRNEKTLGEI